MIFRIIIVFLIVGFATACTRQVPQLPSNKVAATDSSTLSLQAANQKLIAGEDSILQTFVANSSIHFSKSDAGFWYSIQQSAKRNSKPLKGENVKVNLSVYSLSDSLLLRETKTIVVGKKQLINGAEQLLLLMSRGDSATAILPWHLAYGMKGNGSEIPPYTSVLVRLSIF